MAQTDHGGSEQVQMERDATRLTRPTRTAMYGLSSGAGSRGGEAGRFLGGGEGERRLK